MADSSKFVVQVEGDAPAYEVRVESPRGRARGSLKLDLEEKGFASDLARVRGVEPGLDLRRRFGRRLFEALFQGEVLRAWDRSRASAESRQRMLHLLLHIEPPRLAALPWELLHDGEAFLATHAGLALARYLPVQEPAEIPPQAKLRVLLVVASPQAKGLAPVPAGEVEALKAAIGKLSAAVEPGVPVELQTLPDARVATIQDALQQGHHVLHFLGHGESERLFLVGEDGGPRAIKGDEFAQLFLGRPSLRLVVLNACASSQAEEGETLFDGIGPALVGKRLPAVVAMQYPFVLQDTAGKFGQAFYGALRNGKPVEVAVNEGRQLLSAELGLERRDWSTPVLYLGTLQPEGILPQAARPVEGEGVVPAPPLPGPDELPERGPRLPGWRLPHGENWLFTGRQAALKRLAGALLHGEQRAAVVGGMGGVGKTQLAVEFAYRYGRFFGGVHWLHCGQPDLLGAEVAACGEAMGLKPWPAELPEQVERTLAAWREATTGGRPPLAILDNLEDVAAAREWLPRLGGAGVRALLTARRRDWPRDLGLAPLGLRVFSAEESLQFLRGYLAPACAGDRARASEAELAALAERLGHLPLALELAGRYLDGRPLGVGAYVEKLDEALAHPSMQAWRAELGSPTGHDLDLAASFALSWGQVQGEAARRIFQLLGWCAPNRAVPCALLEAAAGLGEEDCGDGLVALRGLGLVEMEEVTAGPAVHPLLAEYGRALAAGAEAGDGEGAGKDAGWQPLPALAGALARLSYEALESRLPARFTPLQPHLEAAAPAAEAAGLEGAGALWNNLGYSLRVVAEYAGARAAHERALGIDEAAYGREHPAVATDVNNLGLVLKDLGDLAGARDAFERALGIDEAAYGREHPNVARDVNNLGAVLTDLGDYDAAQEAYQRALAIFEQNLGEDHPHTATALHDLGSLFRVQGKYAEARTYLERALAVYELVFGESHPWVATAHTNLGLVLRDLGNLDGARAHLEEALAIFERSLPAEHPYIQGVRGNLAALDG